ncbi:cell division protein FtsA [Myxococcota bacterium]|nr:cell division protein FtsA [Myxococcota bacterium]
MGRENVIVGLDIGTSKVSVVIGEETEQGLDVIGLGSHPSDGLRRGVVINIEATVRSIQAAIEEAELMAGCEIGAVYVGIAGGHIRSLNSQGNVTVKEKEVTELDVQRVLDSAQALVIPSDREVIHIIPQEYVVDHQDGIKHPQGMSGVRLGVRVHIVTAAVTSAQNIVKSCNAAGLVVKDIVLAQLASAAACLTDDERELGVMLVDIGGGTTDIAVYRRGAVVHTQVIGLGGDHVTHDIAYGLRTPTQAAEAIKRRYGVAMASMVDRNEVFEVPSVGGHRSREANQMTLAQIVEPRVEEIFALVSQELGRAGFREPLPAGVVVTGGSALLPGLAEVAERVFGMPARVGTPRGVRGLSDVVDSPMYSTGVGLVMYGASNDRSEARFRVREENLYSRVKSRMTEWIGTFF